MSTGGFSMGRAIKKACIDADIDQQDLAAMIGVSRVTMSKMVNAENISTKRVQDICRALGLKPHELVEMAQQQTQLKG